MNDKYGDPIPDELADVTEMVMREVADDVIERMDKRVRTILKRYGIVFTPDNHVNDLLVLELVQAGVDFHQDMILAALNKK